jgi:pSer/pThr/pTyr-binding forkhead associated (FHA) protein
MAKLILTLDGALLGEHDIDKDALTIGRRPSNDVQIDNLAVSGNHAVVRALGDDYFLEDLNSTNGTYIDGKPIKKHLLQHGDLIEVGKYQLRFVDESAIAAGNAADEDFEKTMIIRPAAVQAMVQQPDPAPTPEPPAPEPAPVQAAKPQDGLPVGHIQVLTGPSAGRELVLNKSLTTLGKPGVQVAVISRRPQGFFITHVEGANQPVVNGASIGVQAHALNDHDVIELAGVKMEFFQAGN